MDSPSLKAAIAKKGVTNRYLASRLGLCETAFYNKIQGIKEFKNSEIKTLANELDLDMNAVNSIFFDNAVN